MSIIIHFTGLFDKLKNILTESAFRLHYCREPFYLSEEITSNAVHPMVSFSERYLETIDKKTITYGKLGIAMKKRWVRTNGLHPVLYIDKNSQLAIALADLLKARRANSKTPLPEQVRQSIMTIKCFTKNTQGYNSSFQAADFNFKDEKELRYVPTKDQISGNLVSQSRKKYERDPDKYNEQLRMFPLSFVSKDIQYVFVETEKQRQEISKTFGIDMERVRISNWTTGLKNVVSKKKAAKKEADRIK
jgi:Putative abortive phage resistance protein AbiGi, antitoxin